MDSTPLPEVLGWFADALAVIAVFGALIGVLVESRNQNKAHVTIAPILAAGGVVIFLVGNVLRYVLAAF
jgi:prepilin signal peptidase PulO-like enzyme (type II secretory pathway)